MFSSQATISLFFNKKYIDMRIRDVFGTDAK
jgi:hypothetical protein